MEKFDLIFRGDLVLGHSLDQVKQRLQKLFKADKARIDALFTGRPVTLKRQLDSATTRQYQQALHKAGAQVAVVPSKGAQAPQRPESERTQDRTAEPQKVEPRRAEAGLSLAPREGYLVKPEEHKRPKPMPVAAPNLSLRAAGEPLVASDELGEEPAPAPAVPDFDVAAVGADVLTPSERSVPPPVTPQPGAWELAEPGAELLSPEQRRPAAPPVEFDSTLRLAPRDDADQPSG